MTRRYQWQQIGMVLAALIAPSLFMILLLLSIAAILGWLP